jgi:hypothetical protein
MKGHAGHIEAVFLGGRQQGAPLVSGRSKLGTQTALTAPIVRDNAQDQFNLVGHGSTFFNFRGIVKRDHAHAAADGFDQVRSGLAGIGVDDFGIASGQVLGDLLHQSDFVAGSTVKVASQNSERLDNDGIGVALDGIKGFDAGKVLAPYVVEIENNNE